MGPFNNKSNSSSQYCNSSSAPDSPSAQIDAGDAGDGGDDDTILRNVGRPGAGFSDRPTPS